MNDPRDRGRPPDPSGTDEQLSSIITEAFAAGEDFFGQAAGVYTAAGWQRVDDFQRPWHSSGRGRSSGR